nr:MAG TPA: hypothetical protein [Caudoviricetes sp.]
MYPPADLPQYVNVVKHIHVMLHTNTRKWG